jgi:hypothetical protein
MLGHPSAKRLSQFVAACLEPARGQVHEHLRPGVALDQASSSSKRCRPTKSQKGGDSTYRTFSGRPLSLERRTRLTPCKAHLAHAVALGRTASEARRSRQVEIELGRRLRVLQVITRVAPGA